MTQQSTFIGRKIELQRLEEFLKKAAGGQLQVAFITGEAGAHSFCNPGTLAL